MGALEVPPSKAFEYQDKLIALLLGLVAAGLIWIGSHRIDYGLRSHSTENVWFESDVSRVFETCMRQTNHYRSKVHPIFALIAMPICTALKNFGHLNPDEAVNVYLSITAGVWSALLYMIAIRLAFNRLLASMGTLLGLISAAAMLFLTVPETYGLASVSILTATLLMLESTTSRRPLLNAILASVCSLSITVTNWVLGVLLTFFRYGFRKCIWVSATAPVIIAVLWMLQRPLMPRIDLFPEVAQPSGHSVRSENTSERFQGLSGAVAQEFSYLMRPSPSRLWKVASCLVFHSVVAPDVEQTRDFGIGENIGPVWPTGLSFQNSWPGSGSLLGPAAVLIWALILPLGAWTMMRSRSSFFRPLLLFLGFEFCLHAVYGVETFMYALDWLPILLIIGLYGFQRLGRAGVPVIAIFMTLLAANNLLKFQQIAALLHSYASVHPVIR